MTDIVIGPTFAAEIKTAGLMGLPFAWSAEGVTYGSDLTPQQRAAIEAVVAAHDPSAFDLAGLKTRIKAGIDVQAERERLRYITGGAGQAMTYARKVDQARAVLAASNPQPADYPMLAASIGVDGADLMAVANTIITLDAAWEQIGAAIEAARLSAKRAVDLAEDAAGAQAVVVNWPNTGTE